MVAVNAFHVALYVAALLLCITSLIYTVIQSRVGRLQNRIYILMLLIISANALAAGIGELLEPVKAASQTWFALYRLMQFFYFIVHTALPTVFCYYVMCVTGELTTVYRKRILLYASLFVVLEFLVLLNPFINCIYYFDDNLDFQRNWGEMLLYMGAVIYIGIAFFKLLHSWSALNVRRRRALLYFYFVVVAGVLIQFIDMRINSELFAEALAMLGVMLAVESEDDRLDADTGFYNRKALQMDMDKFISAGRSFHVICIKVTNADIIQRVTGSANTDILSMILSDFLNAQMSWYSIYHTNPKTFLLSCIDMGYEKTQQLEECILKRFDEPWKCRDIEIMLHAIVMSAEIPGKLRTTEDIFFMTDSPAPANMSTKSLSSNGLDYLMRRAEVERALHRGFLEGDLRYIISLHII
ncbi:MAG: hypothetical protein J6P60_02645 [Lachnospiraceae bacterium]|nr:hypothetical protein [Lachnospiraceae bacterium]